MSYKRWDTYYHPPTYTNRGGQVSPKYGSYVIAEDEARARIILKIRGMKETIDTIGHKVVKNRLIELPSKVYRGRRLHETLHTLCFVGNPLIHAKYITHGYLLGDNGLIHEIVHELQFPEDFGYSKEIYKGLKIIDEGMRYLGWTL